MTEEEWDTCTDPYAMIRVARHHIGSPRWRQLARAVCAEAERSRTTDAADSILHIVRWELENPEVYYSDYEIIDLCETFDDTRDPPLRIGNAGLCALIRDILPPLGRQPHIDPRWRRWNNYVVARLAWTIHREGCFDELPVLADALEDAGCQDERLLRHCRQSACHVPGCWAVRLLVFGPE